MNTKRSEVAEEVTAAKHAPATPLPFRASEVETPFAGVLGGHAYMLLGADGEELAIFRAGGRWPARSVAPYTAHACNAYPRLVAELKRLCVEIPKQLGERKAWDNALLRELGEL